MLQVMNLARKPLLTKPVFVLSVDLELGWGFLLNPQHRGLALIQNDRRRAKENIHSLLNLLERYDIKTTWATVGHLFLNPEEDADFITGDLPHFKEGWLDWDYYQDLKNNPVYWGRDIVEEIATNPVKHEIGLHGFFHIPFSQCSREVAKAEIQLGVKAANKLSVDPKSFVFPQSKIGHTGVLRENGIEIYRGKNIRWWSEDQKTLICGFDAGVHKLMPASAFPVCRDNIWELPSSMYFYQPQLPFTLLVQAKLGLYRAIRAKRVFHIWFHPWNLLLIRELAKDLKNFLALVDQKRDKGVLEVMTMGELASSLAQGQGDQA